MVVGLIGMSGVGKSSWAARLAGAGLTPFYCDDLIAERLRVETGAGTVSVHDVGRWMGFPYERRYAERERIYLAYEGAILAEIADHVAADDDVVIDMTGSVVYLEPDLLARIGRLATIVYLAADPDLHQCLLADYLAMPRPVVWNGMFQPFPGEDPAAALVRCYPLLLQTRAALYEQFGDVVIGSTLHRHPAFGVADLLSLAAQATSRARHQATDHPIV